MILTNQVFIVDVHDLASNTLGSVDDQVLVLVHLVHVERLSHVQRALIDRVRHGLVDKLAEKDAIAHRAEESISSNIQRETVLEPLISAQGAVDVVRKSNLLLFRVCVLGARIRLDRLGRVRRLAASQNRAELSDLALSEVDHALHELSQGEALWMCSRVSLSVPMRSVLKGWGCCRLKRTPF